MNKSSERFSCIILAGGEGKRVGGRDKGLINYQGKPLVQHVINTVAAQCDDILISANRNIKDYENYGYKVISDAANHYLGPMAGIAATLPACKNEQVLVVPCDMPLLPNNLIEKLSAGMKQSGLCVAESESHFQLVFLINKNLLPSLLHSLQNNQLRLMQWLKSQHPSVVKFSDARYFKNFNHLEALLH